ncbi:MAG: hypothetical protein EOO77_32895, partial [Oxalobacteraceae bacterium]
MYRFHLHLHEADTIVHDHVGIMRNDLEAVRQEAVRAARDIMCADLAEGRLVLSSHIEVTDETGEVVLSLSFRDLVEVV